MKLNTGFFHITAAVIISVMLIFSCDEGLFNFSDETGNVSINFIADSVSNDLGTVEFSLYNSDTGDELDKEADITYDGDDQIASCYISRVNTGSWELKLAVYDNDGTLVSDAERGADYFELGVGQTAILDYEYFSDGSLDFELESGASSGSDLISMVTLDSLDSLVIVNNYVNSIDSTTWDGAIMIAFGSGFDSSMDGLRLDYPDSSYFELSSALSRSISNIETDIQSDYIYANRVDYTAVGDYSITVTDLNGIQTTETDNCFFDFPADTGYISFSGDDYMGGQVLFNMWELNDAPSDGSVFAYTVNRDDGKDTSEGNLSLDVYDIGSLDTEFSSFGFDNAPTLDISYIVLVTIDIDWETADDAFNNPSEPAYVQYSTNLSVDNLPIWLYGVFGDSLNYIGVSVWEYDS